MWAIRGRIVAVSNQPEVATSESAVFTGRVWIGDDGRIVAVTRGRKAGPPGSAGATVVDVGSSLVIPGLVDLHNHLAYNTLPLWTEPKQHTPFLHHNSWTKADSYSASTTWPAYALITACPHELLGLRRDQGNRRRDDLDPGLAAEEQASRRLAGAQHRRRDVRQPTTRTWSTPRC